MFYKEDFANIIKKIKNEYDSQMEFSEKTGVGRTYLSQYMNMKLDKPPKPTILKKISDNSKGVTTYEELMEVCGYIEVKDRSFDFEKKLKELNEKITKLKIEYNDLNLNNEENLIIEDYNQQDELLKNNFYEIIIDNYNYKDYEIAKEWIDNETVKNLNKILYPNSKNIDENKLIKAFRINSEIKRLEYDIEDTNEQKKRLNINHIQVSSTQTHKRIPVLGSIPAGVPIELIEDIIDYEDISEEMLKGGKEYFGLKVKGTSMWPKYLDGDTIIVLKQNDCESGQDAVVMVNGDDGTFKRVIKKENGITLQPINQQDFDSVYYSNEEIINLPVKILGVVKEIRRSV